MLVVAAVGLSVALGALISYIVHQQSDHNHWTTTSSDVRPC